MITPSQQNLVKFIHILSKERESNKYYVNICILKNLQKPYKTISESISCNISKTFLTRRALKEKLDTQRELQGHLGTLALKAPGHLGTLRALMHLGTQSTWTLDHSGTCTWALVGHLGIQALGHLRHFIQQTHGYSPYLNLFLCVRGIFAFPVTLNKKINDVIFCLLHTYM